MSSLNNRAHRLGARDLHAVNALGDVRTGIMTMRSASGDNLHAPNQMVKTTTVTAVRRSQQAVVAGLQVYARNLSGPADARAFATVRDEANAIIAGTDRTISLTAPPRASPALRARSARRLLPAPRRQASRRDRARELAGGGGERRLRRSSAQQLNQLVDRFALAR